LGLKKGGGDYRIRSLMLAFCPIAKPTEPIQQAKTQVRNQGKEDHETLNKQAKIVRPNNLCFDLDLATVDCMSNRPTSTNRHVHPRAYSYATSDADQQQ
jgi:hypothetical protein